MSLPLPFSGAITTNDLIGRQEELEQIHTALDKHAGTAFRCVLLQAPGGMGKTRLLREVCRKLGVPEDRGTEAPAPDAEWQRAGVIAIPFIDVADPHLHTIVPFLRSVRAGFQTSLEALGEDTMAIQGIFRDFDINIKKYLEARDGAVSFLEIQNLRDSVIQSFQKNYTSLTRTRRVVWAIDTLEQLFVLQPEIEQLFDLAGVERTAGDQTTFAWLSKFITQLPDNTTMLLSGRPFPGRWAIAIRELIERTAAADDRLTSAATTHVIIPLKLSNFTPQETSAYLQALHRQLADSYDHALTASYLETLLQDRDRQQVFHLLTEGNPIRLAVYIDLLLNGDDEPEAFRQKLAEIEAANTDELRTEVSGALLAYLTKSLDRPESQVLELLAIMRRGLDAERLLYIWEEDTPQARAKAQELFNRMMRLSFVKYQPGSTQYRLDADAARAEQKKLLLHDEFYAIYQQSFLLESLDQQESRRQYQHTIFQKLIDFCKDQVRQRIDSVVPLQQEIDEQRHEPGSAEYDRIKEQLRELRQERRRLRTERIHYSLYLDPIQGFYNDYYEFAERAFSAHAVEHDAELQSEIDLFFFGNAQELNRRQAGLDEVSWDLLRFTVIHERVAGWIKRLTVYASYEQAQRLATRAKEHYAQLIDAQYPWVAAVRARDEGQLIEFLFRTEWDANRCIAAIYQGKPLYPDPDDTDTPGMLRVIKELEGIIDTLQRVLQGYVVHPGVPPLGPAYLPECRKRFQNVLAQCMLFVGFGYATINSFEQARSIYKQADELLSKTGFTLLHAEVKNNWSRIEGELGALNKALILCEEGMFMRQVLGFDYLLAMSYNTMALIFTRNARPQRASVWADQALALLRQLNRARGIGLALYQAAEARRRTWMMPIDESARQGLLLRRHKYEELVEAEGYLTEAEEIFAHIVPEKVRELEIYVEKGCLYRDWSQIKEGAEREQMFESALEYLNKAVAIADAEDYLPYRLSTRVNCAWLSRRRGLYAQANQEADDALRIIPSEYLLTPDRAFDPHRRLDVVIFRELSKLYALKADLVELQNQAMHTALEYHILATTYIQLFSTQEAWYRFLNTRKLSRLLSRMKAEGSEAEEQVRKSVEEIIKRYSLRVVSRYLNVLLPVEELLT